MSPGQSPAAPADARQLWRQQRLWAVMVNLLTIPLIAGMLWVNALDVRITSVRVLYGMMAVWLVASFFVRCFQAWRLTRTTGQETATRHWGDYALSELEFCLAVLRLLLALEAVARALPPQSNSSTSYPGSLFVWPDRYAHHNSLGLNDRDWGPNTAGPRILVLGDSYVEGAGVSRQERFCSRLEAGLRKSRPDAHVLAGGRCGWNTQDEEQFLLRHGGDLAPDVVLVAYVLNDAEGRDQLTAQPSRWELWLQTRLRSYLCYRVFRWRRGSMTAYWEQVRQQHQSDSPSWQAVASSLKNIAEWCRQRNIPCELAVLPIFTSDVDSGREVMDQVVSRARSMGYHSYQTLDDFDSRWIEFAVSSHDAHPNAAGHERIANRIATELQASNVLQPLK